MCFPQCRWSAPASPCRPRHPDRNCWGPPQSRHSRSLNIGYQISVHLFYLFQWFSPNGRHLQLTHCWPRPHSSSGLTELGSQSQPRSRHRHWVHSCNMIMYHSGIIDIKIYLELWLHYLPDLVDRNHQHLEDSRHSHNLRNIHCAIKSNMKLTGVWYEDKMCVTLLNAFALCAELIKWAEGIWVGRVGVAVTAWKPKHYPRWEQGGKMIDICINIGTGGFHRRCLFYGR